VRALQGCGVSVGSSGTIFPAGFITSLSSDTMVAAGTFFGTISFYGGSSLTSAGGSDIYVEKVGLGHHIS
jgi:hypothetical protein